MSRQQEFARLRRTGWTVVVDSPWRSVAGWVGDRLAAGAAAVGRAMGRRGWATGGALRAGGRV